MPIEKVTVKWSKKENDWQSKYPEWENRNARIVGNSFFTMIRLYEQEIAQKSGYKDFRDYLDKAGLDPDTFTISVKAKKIN
jgi:hypothetical protein